MALASAARSEPGGWPPAAAISSCARSGIVSAGLPGHEREVFRQPRQLEEPHDARVAGNECEIEAVAPGLVVDAGHERDARRVDELEPAQVDHDVARAAVDGVAQRRLERRD